ncbi:MAG: FtsX-like permease family protein, partial [Terriglobales bacterium]
PFSPAASNPFDFYRRDRSLDPDQRATVGRLRYASDGAFRVLGAKLADGRFFDRDDQRSVDRASASVLRTGTPGSAPPSPVIVNESLAQLYWPRQSATGRIFFANGPCFKCKVVGVVSDFREEAARLSPLPTVYYPVAVGLPFLVRLDPGAAISQFSAAATRRLTQISPSISAPRVETLAAAVAGASRSRRLALWLLCAFAAVALIVAVLGVFAAADESFGDQKRAMAVRIALGASPRQVYGLALERAARMAVVAIPAGIVASFLLMHGMGHLLFSPKTAAVSVGWPTTLLAAAIVAAADAVPCVLAARRAVHADAAAILRSDCW